VSSRPQKQARPLSGLFVFGGRGSRLRGFRSGLESRAMFLLAKTDRDRRPGSKRKALREGIQSKGRMRVSRSGSN